MPYCYPALQCSIPCPVWECSSVIIPLSSSLHLPSWEDILFILHESTTSFIFPESMTSFKLPWSMVYLILPQSMISIMLPWHPMSVILLGSTASFSMPRGIISLNLPGNLSFSIPAYENLLHHPSAIVFPITLPWNTVSIMLIWSTLPVSSFLRAPYPSTCLPRSAVYIIFPGTSLFVIVSGSMIYYFPPWGVFGCHSPLTMWSAIGIGALLR